MQKLHNIFRSFVGPLIEIVRVMAQWTPPQTAGHHDAKAG